MDCERINFASIEADVDEEGLINPLEIDETGMGIETSYARLIGARTTDTFAEFHGELNGGYVAIRIPLSALHDLLADGLTNNMRLVD